MNLEPIKYLAFDERIPLDKQVQIWRESLFALGTKWMARIEELRVLDRDGKLLWKKDAKPDDCYFDTPEQALAAAEKYYVHILSKYGTELDEMIKGQERMEKIFSDDSGST